MVHARAEIVLRRPVLCNRPSTSHIRCAASGGAESIQRPSTPEDRGDKDAKHASPVLLRGSADNMRPGIDRSRDS